MFYTVIKFGNNKEMVGHNGFTTKAEAKEKITKNLPLLRMAFPNADFKVYILEK